jgi:AcrR family transcriptional regulator
MSNEPLASGGAAPEDARERILYTAYNLFCRHGTLVVGVDRIVAEAQVAKMTLYRHFASKEELVLATLELREELWTRRWLEGEIEKRDPTPEGRLLAIFDIFDDWLRRDDYEGCCFTNAMTEAHHPASPIGAATIAKRVNIRGYVRGLADAAGVRDPDGFAHQWQLLMTGAVVKALEGDREAAQRARDVAVLVLDRERL